tara:strand:+ start:1187 stop:1366 length:180 start_codon:yes stop_codon:yes gene_type:complete
MILIKYNFLFNTIVMSKFIENILILFDTEYRKIVQIVAIKVIDKEIVEKFNRYNSERSR